MKIFWERSIMKWPEHYMQFLSLQIFYPIVCLSHGNFWSLDQNVQNHGFHVPQDGFTYKFSLLISRISVTRYSWRAWRSSLWDWDFLLFISVVASSALGFLGFGGGILHPERYSAFLNQCNCPKISSIANLVPYFVSESTLFVHWSYSLSQSIFIHTFSLRSRWLFADLIPNGLWNCRWRVLQSTNFPLNYLCLTSPKHENQIKSWSQFQQFILFYLSEVWTVLLLSFSSISRFRCRFEFSIW